MQLEVVCQARSTSSEVTSYKVLRRDSVTSHSEMLFETNFWLICIWQTGPSSTCLCIARFYHSKIWMRQVTIISLKSHLSKPVILMYPVVTITNTTTYIQKRGWGSEPLTQTTTSYEGGFSHLVTSIHFGSLLCLLQSWLLVAISCTNKCNPTQILYATSDMVPRPPLASIA